VDGDKENIFKNLKNSYEADRIIRSEQRMKTSGIKSGLFKKHWHFLEESDCSQL
jgi:hypothetical protein